MRHGTSSSKRRGQKTDIRWVQLQRDFQWSIGLKRFWLEGWAGDGSGTAGGVPEKRSDPVLRPADAALSATDTVGLWGARPAWPGGPTSINHPTIPHSTPSRRFLSSPIPHWSRIPPLLALRTPFAFGSRAELSWRHRCRCVSTLQLLSRTSYSRVLPRSTITTSEPSSPALSSTEPRLFRKLNPQNITHHGRAHAEHQAVGQRADRQHAARPPEQDPTVAGHRGRGVR